jgi:death-on-curing protein
MGQIAEPVWIETELALAIHDRQLAEHGGPIGVRDSSALESALGRPRNQWAYGQAISALWRLPMPMEWRAIIPSRME